MAQKIVIIIVWTVFVGLATPFVVGFVLGLLLPNLPASVSTQAALIGLVGFTFVATAAATLFTLFQGIKGRLPGITPSNLHSAPPRAYKCPTCGYALRGVTGVYCPECGTVRPASPGDNQESA